MHKNLSHTTVQSAVFIGHYQQDILLYTLLKVIIYAEQGVQLNLVFIINILVCQPLCVTMVILQEPFLLAVQNHVFWSFFNGDVG